MLTDNEIKNKAEEAKERGKTFWEKLVAFVEPRKLTITAMGILALVGFVIDGAVKLYVHMHPVKAIFHGIVLSRIEWKLAVAIILAMIFVAVLGMLRRSD